VSFSTVLGSVYDGDHDNVVWILGYHSCVLWGWLCAHLATRSV